MDSVGAPVDARELQITRLMNEHGRTLIRLCYLYLKDAALAEDAVQETFLKAFQALDGFRAEASEQTWLTRIAVNTCRDFLRTAWFRRIDRKIGFDQLKEPAHHPEMPDPTVSLEIMRLPVKQREVILLHYYQELPVKEMAQILKVPVGTIKSRLSRAREQLANTLEGWYFDED